MVNGRRLQRDEVALCDLTGPDDIKASWQVQKKPRIVVEDEEDDDDE